MPKPCITSYWIFFSVFNFLCKALEAIEQNVYGHCFCGSSHGYFCGEIREKFCCKGSLWFFRCLRIEKYWQPGQHNGKQFWALRTMMMHFLHELSFKSIHGCVIFQELVKVYENETITRIFNTNKLWIVLSKWLLDR